MQVQRNVHVIGRGPGRRPDPHGRGGEARGPSLLEHGAFLARG